MRSIEICIGRCSGQGWLSGRRGYEISYCGLVPPTSGSPNADYQNLKLPSLSKPKKLTKRTIELEKPSRRKRNLKRRFPNSLDNSVIRSWRQIQNAIKSLPSLIPPRTPPQLVCHRHQYKCRLPPRLSSVRHYVPLVISSLLLISLPLPAR